MLAGFGVTGPGALGLPLFHGMVGEREIFVIPTRIASVAVLIVISNILTLFVLAVRRGRLRPLAGSA